MSLQSPALLLLLTVASPVTGLAQQAAPLADPHARGYHPSPAPTLALAPAQPGTTRFAVLFRAKGDSSYRPFGEATVTRTLEGPPGKQLVRNVTRYDWPSHKVTLDTTVALSGTYAPISERTLTPSMRVTYDFDGLRVVGQIGPVDSLRPIAVRLPAAAFNSTDLDMLIPALPLTDTFSALLPLYDPEFPGFRVARLHVTGREPVRTARDTMDAWVIVVEEPGHPPLFYRVAVVTHQLLQKDFGSPGGPAFRLRWIPAA